MNEGSCISIGNRPALWPVGFLEERGLRIATGALRPRNDTVFYMGCRGFLGVRRGEALLPTVAPTDSRPLSWPPIGAHPRNHLASPATGSASAISPPAGDRMGRPYGERMVWKAAGHMGPALQYITLFCRGRRPRRPADRRAIVHPPGLLRSPGGYCFLSFVQWSLRQQAVSS